MLRYKLRTLLILLAILPPALAGLLWVVYTPRALPVLGPSVVVALVAVAFSVARIKSLTRKR